MISTVKTAAAVLVAAFGLTACQNYTVAPVCTQANAAVPHGITGTYTLAIQNEDFTVATSSFNIGMDSDKKLHKRSSAQGDQSSSLCQVGGYFVEESYNEDVKAYQQSRLYVTGMGLSEVPLFYDKDGLDRAGVPLHTVTIPANVRAVLGTSMSHGVEAAAQRLLKATDQPIVGLIIDNTDVQTAALMSQAYASPVSLNFLRQ